MRKAKKPLFSLNINEKLVDLRLFSRISTILSNFFLMLMVFQSETLVFDFFTLSEACHFSRKC